MSHCCEVCSKKYNNYNGLWKHKKKYHSTTENENRSITSNLLCQYCNKKYSRIDNLHRHLQICKEKPEILIKNNQKDMSHILELTNNIISEDQNLTKSILNFITENFSKIQPNMLQSQNPSGNNNPVGDNNKINNPYSNNTNSNNTNSNNTNIIGNITISLGNENLSDVVSKNDQIKILKQKNDALLEIIKLVHFSSKYPQFHNIAIQGDKAYQYNDTEQKFLETPKDIMLFDLIENRVNDIYDFNEENKLSLSKKTYSWIKCYTNMFNFETRIKNSIEKIEPVIETESNKLITTNQIKL